MSEKKSICLGLCVCVNVYLLYFSKWWYWGAVVVEVVVEEVVVVVICQIVEMNGLVCLVDLLWIRWFRSVSFFSFLFFRNGLVMCELVDVVCAFRNVIVSPIFLCS